MELALMIMFLVAMVLVIILLGLCCAFVLIKVCNSMTEEQLESVQKGLMDNPDLQSPVVVYGRRG